MNRLLLLTLAAATTLCATGCYSDPPYAPAYTAAVPPPPPPYYGNPRPREADVPPLVQLAERNGFRAGSDDGARDAYYRAGYGPRRDQKYRDAPGYDYRLGPIPPYVDAFRAAYLRGYERAFSNHDQPR